MSNVIDLTGKKFNYLTVMYATGHIEGKKGYFWHCKCDCGNEVDVLGESLKSGNTTACGCRKSVGWGNSYKHGMSGTRIYRIWMAMKRRCLNKNDDYYYNYGGRGITICNEWLGDNGFQNFYKWSKENGYTDELTIDRINNDGDYEPSNCRWATRFEQMKNTRNTRRFEYNGKLYTAKELEGFYGVTSTVIYQRIVSHGWNIEDAIKIPVRGGKNVS